MPAPTMPRGRARKFNKAIPKHIDQTALPKGMYFNPAGSGHWYILVGKRKRYIAGAATKLSELHRILEDGNATPEHTVDWLCAQHKASERYRKRAPATQADYAYCAGIICEFRMKDGSRFGGLDARKLSRPVLQRLVDAVGKGTARDADGKLIATPTKAAHVGRYLGVLTSWGANRGHCPAGIGNKLDLPEERGAHRMPETAQHEAIVAFAKENGHGRRGKAGSVAGYLWAVAEIAYLCRLRGIEVLDLSDSSATEEGVYCVRRKGSKPTLVEWDERLHAAWDYLIEVRKDCWDRRKSAWPMRADDRPLVVGLTGGRLRRRALTVSWRKMVLLAVEQGHLASSARFGLHALKHRGVTDTAGGADAKQEASGHKTRQMGQRYDHSVATVQPARKTLGKIRSEPAK